MLHEPTHKESLRQTLASRYIQCRQTSLNICAPLEDEDFSIQSMPDVSPPKWHLAHTSWFFETFILIPYNPDYRFFNPEFPTLFNSYYQSVGQFHPRSERGNLSRPSHRLILQYRQAVDEAILELLTQAQVEHLAKITELVEIGINHEQQHQELMLMDIKYNFFKNPLYPTYNSAAAAPDQTVSGPLTNRSLQWRQLPEGIYQVGAQPGKFAYDNELGRHRVFIEPVQLADRLITNAEYLEFIEDQGYQRFDLWLSQGWNLIQKEQISQPLYWLKDSNRWLEFTFHGLHPIDPLRAVMHISYFEADAFARWKNCRLPSESEWESMAQNFPINGQFLDLTELRPQIIDPSSSNHQFFGDAWEWTSSSYGPYPGFKPQQGALGEYNGKFMANQYVLRGGAFVTPQDHIRSSYRNYFPSDSRWMFSGIRLAKEE